MSHNRHGKPGRRTAKRRRIRRCAAVCSCKRKPRCTNKLTRTETERLIRILNEMTKLLPDVVLHQNAENIRRLRLQLRRLLRLIGKSRICPKRKLRLQVALKLILSILDELAAPAFNIVIQMEQITVEVTNIVQILQNTQQEINAINTTILNMETVINNILESPGAPGQPGPAGPPGPQGPQGPQGIPGTFSPVYANIFDTGDQRLTANQPVRFNQFDQPGSIIRGGIAATQTSLTVPAAGDYAVLWETMFLPNAGETHCAFGVFVNGSLRDATRSGLAAFPDQEINNIGSVAIIALNAGDTVELRALIPMTSTQTGFDLSARIQYPPFGGAADQPINSASLRIFRLGP